LNVVACFGTVEELSILKIPMFIGYARVSTEDQHLHLQIDALKKAGCKKIFSDEMSGTKSERPGLGGALTFMRPGDTLVVWRLDRLGRSLKDLIQRVEELKQRQVEFRSVIENIDTSNSGGKFMFHLFSALAEFERELIRERTMAGLTAARARGRFGGRPKIMPADKIKMAASLMRTPNVSIKDICKNLGISRTTLYRYVGPKGEVRDHQE
jgi:DNA invertase Pin-like site-specific DNA recombinase